MRKVVAIAVAALLCVGSILPYWGGFRARQEHERFLAWLGDWVELPPVRYERGWLRSTALARFVAGGSGEEGGARIGFALEHHIAHGPIPFGELLRGRLPPGLAFAVIESELRVELPDDPELAVVVGDRPVLSVLTTLHAEGYGEARFSILPIRKDKDWTATGVDWQGASGTLLFTRDFGKATATLHGSGLDLVTNAVRLRIRDVAAEADVETDALGVPLGRSVLSLASVKIAEADDPAQHLALRDLRWEQSVENDGDALRLRAALTFDEVRSGDAVFGPAEFELVLRNLDARALARVQGRAREIARSDASDAERRMALLGAGVELVPQVLSRSPELELSRLRIASDDGDLEATARIGLRKDANELQALDPLLAADAIEAVAELSIPAPMLHRVMEALLARDFEIAQFAPGVEAVEKMDDVEREAAQDAARAAMRAAVVERRGAVVDDWLARGVLLRDGDAYRLRVEYATGTLLLNGQPFEAGPLGGAERTTASAFGGAWGAP